MFTIYPVVMSGGSGTRLWPSSRKATPKQHLSLATENTLLEDTLRRVMAGTGEMTIAAPTVICGADHVDEVRGTYERLGLDEAGIIVEPTGRNTAPVAMIAALSVHDRDPDGVVLLLPADHYVTDVEGFWQAVADALGGVDAGRIVTLGIAPGYPETGYGYIRSGAQLDGRVREVDAFVEKPDLDTARGYLAKGNYYWNAGIFAYAAGTMLAEGEAHAPDILRDARRALEKATRNDTLVHLDAESFASCRSESIDYAIMEATSKAAIVAPVAVGWNDIGSWAAVAELAAERSAADSENMFTKDCETTHIRTDGPFVAALGVSDLIVVATGDAVLVAHRNRAQDVKAVIEHLKSTGREDLL